MMKNKPIIISILTILSFVFALALPHQGNCDETEILFRQRRQIQLLNLLNGLELDQQQTNLILNSAIKAKNINQQFIEAIVRDKDRIYKIHEDVLNVAKKGSLVMPEETKRKVHQLQVQIDEQKAQIQKETNKLVNGIEKSLHPFQIAAIEDYQPCIIPPISEGRIGQSNSFGGFAKKLEHVNRLDDNRYQLKRYDFAEILKKKIISKIPTGKSIDENDLEITLLKKLDKVHHMPQDEFLIQKDALVEEFKKMIPSHNKKTEVGIKIKRMLLDPDIIPLLEQRLESFTKTSAP